MLQVYRVTSLMKSGWNIGKLRKGRLLRAVALLFLLHTGVDLVFPQLCSEEAVGVMAISASAALPPQANSRESSGTVALSASSDPEREQRSDPPPRDEDCFCCCTHVMPSPLFITPGNAELSLPPTFRQNISILSAPPNNPYHPPRIA